jgi:hypothetical protein
MKSDWGTMFRRALHHFFFSPVAIPVPPRFPGLSTPLGRLSVRFNRHQAYEDSFDPIDLLEARIWRHAFDISRIPKGQTIFSRSSGPGGQHVNKYVYPSSPRSYHEMLMTPQDRDKSNNNLARIPTDAHPPQDHATSSPHIKVLYSSKGLSKLASADLAEQDG